MSIRKYLEALPASDIIKYIPTGDFSKEAVPFTGSIRKHPYDQDKLLLISSPFSSKTEYFEFMLSDVMHHERMPSIATEDGDSITITKIWVKKGSFGIQYHPFEVNNPLRYMNDSELLHQAINDQDREE